MGRMMRLLVAVVFTAVAVAGAAQAQNLLLNPGFEIDPVEDGLAPAWAKYRSGDGIDGWLKPWTGPPPEFTDWVAAGGQWLPGQWVFWGQSVPCSPGQSVDFQMMSAGYPTFNGSTILKLEFYAPNQEGGSMAISVVESFPVNGSHIWQLQTVNAVVPAGAVRVRAMGWIQGAASGTAQGSAKFDDGVLTTANVPPLVTPGEVNGLPDNTLVWLKWPVVTKDLGSDETKTDVLVTGYHREGSCRVISNDPIYSNNVAVAVTEGAMLHVVGTVATLNGQKVVMATDVVPTNWDGPWPKKYIMNTKSLASDPDTTGLIVQVVGQVTSVAPDYTYFYLSDGANLPGEAGNVGVKVYMEGTEESYPRTGDTVSVTGISDTEVGGDSQDYRILTTRDSTDFAIVNIGGGEPGRNLLLNPGFEAGADNWFTSDSVAPEGWAALNGALGMAFYAWDDYAEAYVGQKVPNIVPGATYQFTASLKEEVNHVGVVKMRIQWFDDQGAQIGADVEQVVDPPIDWGSFSLSGVAPANAVSGDFLILDTDHSPSVDPNLQAVMVDDTVVKITAEP